MIIEIINEAGYKEALLGLSLSFNKNPNEMDNVAIKLADKDGGHNKFLESIVVWLDIKAPRYWWSEFDTYRVGTTKQSESTMHTLLKQPLTNDNFEKPIDLKYLNYLNFLIEEKKLEDVKNLLPEGFLQRRIVCTNYKVLRNMLQQRKNHKLPQWRYFYDIISKNIQHSELLKEI